MHGQTTLKLEISLLKWFAWGRKEMHMHGVLVGKPGKEVTWKT